MIPNLWTHSRGSAFAERLRLEAQALSATHRLPASVAEWQQRADTLRAELNRRFRLEEESAGPLEPIHHHRLEREGYQVEPVSFLTHGSIRMTGTLYRPDGPGPFPAVLNVHGHHREGKLAERVQSRGHQLAQRGFVVLSVDAAGSGERGTQERQWVYHGGIQAAGFWLAGDSLLAAQIRDNRRALDFLQSLPYVDGERIGLTGASGGGNQTMWLAALDPRVKVAAPVVSTGTFESYIARTNCMCETLPGGLALAETWMLFGLIAPRPLLLQQSLHDQPTFAVDVAGRTAAKTKALYELLDAGERFDLRFYDLPHGYWPPMVEGTLGWMSYWLKNEGPATPRPLLPERPFSEEELICFPQGERPAEVAYARQRRLCITRALEASPAPAAAPDRDALKQLLGWREIEPQTVTLTPGRHAGEAVLLSPRGLEIPVVLREKEENITAIRLVLSPDGKNAPLIQREWSSAAPLIATLDLPATGELEWTPSAPIGGARFHDPARACAWLGYSLATEWAETIVAAAIALRTRYPQASITLVAEREAALAALIAAALHPGLTVEEHETPRSLNDLIDAEEESLVWFIPGLRQWGDLDSLRALR